MNKEKRIEQQIQHFYDNVPDVDDAFPLKEYLLKHEDSRMAWYLLGKQYEGKGDTAKATYCFGQAGDIYTAFEGKPAPSLPEPKNDSSKQRKAFWIWTTVFTVLIGAIGFGLYAIMQERQQSEAVNQEQPADTVGTPSPSVEAVLKDQPSPMPIVVEVDAPLGAVSAARDPLKDGQTALGALLLLPSFNNDARMLVQAAYLGRWNDWVKSGKPLATVAVDDKLGSSGVNWHDAKWCNCKPQDPSSAQKRIQEWKPLQESKLALRSAIVRYKERTGNWPANPEALNGDYPNNTIAGWSEEMTPWFEEVMGELTNPKDGKLPTTVGWPTVTGPIAGMGAPEGAISPIAQQPLAIIVDKKSHRLAVVSGDVIVRNYEVGLGGVRTPEGSFVITEKVRNPNGTDQGIYGSRGMTLSDGDYGIHGTDKPGSIGKDESLGCVRMKKEDIEELFDLVPIGTPVTITQGGLPSEPRVPAERFKLSNAKNETNPHKVYNWLD